METLIAELPKNPKEGKVEVERGREEKGGWWWWWEEAEGGRGWWPEEAKTQGLLRTSFCIIKFVAFHSEREVLVYRNALENPKKKKENEEREGRKQGF